MSRWAGGTFFVVLSCQDVRNQRSATVWRYSHYISGSRGMTESSNVQATKDFILSSHELAYPSFHMMLFALPWIRLQLATAVFFKDCLTFSRIESSHQDQSPKHSRGHGATELDIIYWNELMERFQYDHYILLSFKQAYYGARAHGNTLNTI